MSIYSQTKVEKKNEGCLKTECQVKVKENI